jgi:hypothetical protein
VPGADVVRVHAPAGRFLLLCSEGALAMAFEAPLFDLLAESRYPAPRPRRLATRGHQARSWRPRRRPRRSSSRSGGCWRGCTSSPRCTPRRCRILLTESRCSPGFRRGRIATRYWRR